uniref:NADH dehydrogenase subunit 6 n=1 Tax=Bovicola bovis TaxID=160097 RepID=A0A386B275_9NEOP|nr:NADH dehydrogenase subunit 6 [Bovicola bovis]
MEFITICSSVLLWFSFTSMVGMISTVFLAVSVSSYLILSSGTSVMGQILFLSYVGGLVALVSFMVSTHDDSASKAMEGKSSLSILTLSLLIFVILKEPLCYGVDFILPHLEGVMLVEIYHEMGLLGEKFLVSTVILSISILFFGLFMIHEICRLYNQEDFLYR